MNEEENKDQVLSEYETVVNNHTEDKPPTPSDIQVTQKFWQTFGDDLLRGLANDLYSMTSNMEWINRIGRSATYNPPTAQDYTRDININVKEPTIDSLKSWLKNPSMNSSSLIGASQYMLNTIMQYKRICDFSTKMLLFNCELIPAGSPKTGQETEWLNGYDRCLNKLSKIKHRYEFSKIMKKTMEDGGMFVYLNEQPEIISFVEIPSEWCYITGKWDWGYTWAIDLTYYDKFVGLVGVTPELISYYNTFIKMRDAGARGSALAQYQYYPVPAESGYVFTFNPLRAEIVPPYSATMIDGIAILDYKNMVKQQMALDTIAIIAQEIPKDKDNKPIIDGVTAQKLISMTANILPKQVATFATPFKAEKLSFSSAQGMNNWIGTGEKVYWNTSGTTSIMNGETSNGLAIEYSMLNDFGFVEHMYQQFENFMNIQLWLVSCKHKFNIKYFGNRYTQKEDVKTYASLVSMQNMPVSKLYGMVGYEPYEIDSIIYLEKIKKWRETIPLTPASQAGSLSNDKGGAPEKDLSEMKQSGINTRDRQDNMG